MADLLPEDIKQEGDVFTLTGEVVEILPNSKYKVKLHNGIMLLGHASGKIRKNRIKILQFDTVSIEISGSDLENLKNQNNMVNGRITFRYKSNSQ